MSDKPWNKCEACGKYIAMADFDRGAVRELATPDSEFTAEEYRTLCIVCATKRELAFDSEIA